MGTSFRNCIVAGLLLAPILMASADDGKSRYVSGAGRDEGDCLNKFRPCRSLNYAISKAGKGDIVTVAEGSYELRHAQDLNDLLSVQGRIAAGYDGFTGFSDRTASNKTVLIGVPPELRDRFERDGFTVITDSKGLFESSAEREARENKSALATKVRSTEQRHKSAACVSNQSNGFACQNVSLHAHLPFDQMKPASSRGNDIWGFVDLNTGREYAFMGLQNGVAIVDISNPDAPEQVAFATGTGTTWRDTNVYQYYDATAKRWRAYAYVTADNVQDFMMVLDLSGLPNGVERVDFASDFRAAHTAYLINADFTFGLAQRNEVPRLAVSGSNIGAPRGSYRVYSLAQPRNPQLLTESTSGYSHDLASFAVKDARKNTQCVNAATASACEILTDFNENTFDLWDVTNASSPQLLVSQPYDGRAFTHSGWWTEDGRHLFVHDELDEQNLGLATTVRVFDMANLRSPTLVGTWTGPTRAIDHNGYVRGNRFYFSNYSEGLTVLDSTNPASPQRIGYFDTYPAGAQTAFVGAWGAYPFFASGTIAVSDINSGLYLLKDETLQSPNGTFAFTTRKVAGSEGQQVVLSISRANGSVGAVSIDLDVLYGTAGANDATLALTRVNWPTNDNQPKSVTLNLASDGESEEMELLLVRLKNPVGGATIGYPDTAYAYVTEPGAANKLRLLEANVRVDEVRRKALVTVTRAGSLSGSAQVSYRTLAPGTYIGFTPTQGHLTWADGDAEPKIIAIDLDPSRLVAGETGSFQVELHAPTNTSLESNGVASGTLTASVTVLGEGQAPVTPAPTPPIGGGASNNSGKGGGAIAMWWLALLALLAGARRKMSNARAR